MKKYICFIPIAILGLCLAVNAAHRDNELMAPCGLGGIVYDSQGQPAGSKFSIIVVRYSTGIRDSAAYYYRSGDSYYRINCTYGLQSGTFRAYARTYENGSYWYSNWTPAYVWQPHWDLGSHNFNCTRTTPPPIIDDDN